MHRNDAIALAHSRWDNGDFLHDLARRVALRTESDSGAPPASLQGYLQDELQPALQALGFACTLVPNPAPQGGPFLIAQRIENPQAPTLLTYGHGDVVSGQDAAWSEGRSPWVLRQEGDRIYGRGTADNKGQHSINLEALRAVLQARGGQLGYNMTWLVEMGEEAGSPGLHAVAQSHREQLRADVFLASDGPRVRAQVPTLFLGSRGGVNFRLRLRERAKAYHSGNWGGVLRNPATVLCHAWATLVDARGAIQVPALRPPALSPAVRNALAAIAIGTGDDDPPLSAHWGEPGLSAAERLMGWNTLEILAMTAGQPQRPINAIPSEATLYGQLRFVVGTPWEDLQSILRDHLAAQGFEHIEVEILLTGAATRLEPDHPWVEWTVESVVRTGQQAPDVLPNLAGSLPNDVFAQLLGLPTLWLPHSYAACGQHAPNEHMLGSIARSGLGLMAGLLWDLGEPDAPWWPTSPRFVSTTTAGQPS